MGPIEIVGLISVSSGVEMIKRSAIDHRSGDDRRVEYYISMFVRGGIEQRSHTERRSGPERRNEWTRINQWSSIHVPITSGL